MKRGPALVAFSVVLFCSRMSARANGAFPDSMGILLPVDQPNRIIATTNFGLLVSEDSGATWGWVCEQAIGLNTFLYEQSAPPNDLVLAASVDGVTYSGDFGCTWNRSGGEISSYYAYDISPHAVAPLRSYALAQHTQPSIVTAHESQDGARTFGPAFLTSSESQYFTGIENARSRPATLYVTLRTVGLAVRPYVARSYDSGASWQPLFDPGPDFDRWSIDLLAVDPVNEHRVYLRMRSFSTGGEALGIYDDDPVGGGGMLRTALQIGLSSRMTAFLRRSDGALIVGTLNAQAYISTDQGANFVPWPTSLHLRALGERNGILYAVTDNFLDGYAVARSVNQGATWESLIRFEQLTGPKNCGNLPTTCAVPWQVLRQRLGLDGGVDAGTDGGIDAGIDGGSDGGTNGGTDAGTDGGAEPPANQRPSACTESAEGVSWSASAIIFAIVALRFLAARSRSRQ